MTTQIERLTISLPRDLVALTNEIAREEKISRSKVVSICLQELADKRLRREMEEGYKVMANEHLMLAREAIKIAHEVIPEWK